MEIRKSLINRLVIFIVIKLKVINKEYKKEILSLSIVKDAINNAKSEAYKDCNTDWSGLQGGY